MNEVILKLIDVLNKPLHFICLGIVLILWGVFTAEKTILFGILLLVAGTVSYIEKFVAYKKNIRINKLNEQDKLDKKEKYRKQIIQDYKKLNHAEKFIVDYCLNNNTLVCNQIWMKREDSCSLAKKGFGKAESFGDTFFIYRECTDILNQYQREQNSIEKENKKVRKVKK